MKTKLEVNVLQSLPSATRKRLTEEIDEGTIDLIFVTSPPFTAISKVTVVMNKCITNEKKKELQEALWIRKVFEEFAIIISICSHQVFPFKSDFHFTYISLNLHPSFIVYSRTEKTYRSLFQNHYHFCLNNQLKQFNKWIKHWEVKQEKLIEQFVVPLMENKHYEAVVVFYKQILRIHINLIHKMLFPNNLKILDEESSFLKFLKEYYPDLWEVFLTDDLEESYMLRLLNPFYITPDLCEKEVEAIQQSYNQIASTFTKQLKALFREKVERLFLNIDCKQLYTTDQYNQAIYKVIKEKLFEEHRINLIYFLNSRRTNNGIEILLFIVGAGITAKVENKICYDIKSMFKGNLELTVLLHKPCWIKHHAQKFLPFIYKNLNDTNLIYSRSEKTHLNFIEPAFDITDGNKNYQKQYWKLCQHNLENYYKQVSLDWSHGFSSYNIIHLRNIFKQLCLAYLYKKVHYLPYLKSPRYLWKLIGWQDAGLAEKLVPTTISRKAFKLLNRLQPYFPEEKVVVSQADSELYEDILQRCSDFYKHIKEIYQN